MAARKKAGGRKYGKSAGKRVASAMRRRKKGTLKSGRGGKGGKVKSRKQAIAIGLSEARKKAQRFRARRAHGRSVCSHPRHRGVSISQHSIIQSVE
jgi:hypothetical protein